MNVQVLVNQEGAPESLRAWVSRRLLEVLGAAASTVSSAAVAVSPVSRGVERLMRCSVVVQTDHGRRIVETRDADSRAALERAMRLVALSLFAEATPQEASSDKPSPPT